jgi:hypothetical protein
VFRAATEGSGLWSVGRRTLRPLPAVTVPLGVQNRERREPALASVDQTAMSENKFPEGWDEKRVQAVIAHYEEQTDEEAVAEDEAGADVVDDLRSRIWDD